MRVVCGHGRTLTSLIASCRELGIDKDAIPRWEAILKKLPEYRINKDGTLAEWSHRALGDRYGHRHNSHLFGVYPALEITKGDTLKIYDTPGRDLSHQTRLEVVVISQPPGLFGRLGGCRVPMARCGSCAGGHISWWLRPCYLR